jgi:hypothetical protein
VVKGGVRSHLADSLQSREFEKVSES